MRTVPINPHTLTLEELFEKFAFQTSGLAGFHTFGRRYRQSFARQEFSRRLQEKIVTPQELTELFEANKEKFFQTDKERDKVKGQYSYDDFQNEFIPSWETLLEDYQESLKILESKSA